MPFDIRVPSSGELGDEITLTAWRKKTGDSVERGDVLAEIEADKGVLEIEAVVEGTLGSISVEEGSAVDPGDVIGTIRTEEDESGGARPEPAVESSAEEAESGPAAETAGETPGLKPAGKPAVPAPKEVTAAETSQAAGSRKKAAPIARRMAREAGIDIEEIPGNGPGGVITRADAEAYLGTSSAGRAAGGTETRRTTAPSTGREGEGPAGLTPNRKSVIRTVTASHREIPAVRFAGTVSMGRALRIKREGGLLWDSLFVKAAAVVIAKMPAFTSYVDLAGRDDPAGIRIESRKAVNIAFALGKGDELYAPVIKGADRLDLGEINRRISEYISRAENGRFSRDDFADGSLLISNLGKYGLDWFEAMVYPGHTAALSFGAVQEKPVVLGGGIHIKPVMEIVLAADHRIVNGIQAAEFLKAYKKYLEEEI